MKSISQIPGCLAIVKVDERHYQLTDTSVPAIGMCLGVFPSHAAAESFADKFVRIRERERAGKKVDREIQPAVIKAAQREPQVVQSIH
jgi:hypothetical protein